jgi:hypothetical protein
MADNPNTLLSFGSFAVELFCFGVVMTLKSYMRGDRVTLLDESTIKQLAEVPETQIERTRRNKSG